ncbi:hypothetical protein GEMRC1_011081 [Eukaryota sp. GEM-RC1]
MVLPSSLWLGRGISFTNDNRHVVTGSDDKTIKYWSLSTPSPTAVRTLLSPHPVHSVDSSWLGTPKIASAGTNGCINIWSDQTADPIHTFQWGEDTLTHVQFNPSEPDILSTTGYDRCLTLFDLRQQTPLKRIQMEMRCNQTSWIPTEPMNFLAASEDSNVYLFDMRNLSKALGVFKGHVGPVLSVSCSPTGRTFVSGSYDKTLRIWNTRTSECKDVYHTERMQRLFSVLYTMDSNFVLSGSDDGCVRVWKSNSSDQLAPISAREQTSRNVATALKKKYKDVPELSRIDRKRHLPKLVHKLKVQRHERGQRERDKRKNVVKHSKPGSVPSVVPEKKKKIEKVVD